MKFVVVLTFLSGIAGHPHQETIQCSTPVCVGRFIEHAHESRRLSRLRVWEAGDYAPLSLGDAHVWPPFVDRWYQ